MTKWYKLWVTIGFILMTAIEVYIAIDIYHNFRNGKSIAADLAALFAIAAWKNVSRLAQKCHAGDKKEVAPETTNKKFYRLERD